MLAQYLLERLTGVWTAPVAVKQQPRLRLGTALQSSHLERIHDQLTPHLFVQRPPMFGWEQRQ